MNTDTLMMQRALQIARNGFPFAMPNPMVGAVIVGADGTIIGEGYHRRCGEAHAEVNAVAAVADTRLLRQSTMYVTLEPCAHYGRTGPCARLIIEKGIPRVVVATRDPFEKVDGRGIEMLREAGIEVSVGLLGEESRRLNAVFFTAHTQHRPFIILKWAQTADGYIDAEGDSPLAISNAVTRLMAHRLRSACDAILVGSGTVLRDNPMLDNRLAPGPSPRPVLMDRRHRIHGSSRILGRNPIIIDDNESLQLQMGRLYERGITSLLVEGGAQVLQSFIDAGLWDLARIETSPLVVGEGGSVKAPAIYDTYFAKSRNIAGHLVKYYSRNPLIDVKNI